jgi:interleukin-1 receptor-associated kinase 1
VKLCIDQARPLLSQALEEDGNFSELVDPFLEGNYNHQEMIRLAACASSSIRHSAKKRSKMSQVYLIINNIYR